MKWFSFFITIIMLLFLMSCSKTPIEAPFMHNSAVEGFVAFENSSPDTLIATIRVYFQGETILIAQTQTDTTGYYFIDKLSTGTYQISISAEIYKIHNISDIELAANETTTVDTIELILLTPIEYKEIIIDGEIDNGWESAYENNNASSWSSTNDFENLYIARDDDSLYIAVDGGFDPGGNTVNIYIDIDYQQGTGLNDFSNIAGGDYGDHLRKNVTTTSDFGADIAFSAWAIIYDVGVVSLEDESNVDDHIIEEANISLNSSVIEFAIPFSALYENDEIPFGQKIALVAIIGGGEDGSFADDTIPQESVIEDGGMTFLTVFSRAY